MHHPWCQFNNTSTHAGAGALASALPLPASAAAQAAAGVNRNSAASRLKITDIRAFEPYRLAWAQDILQVGTLDVAAAPLNRRPYKAIRESTATPLAAGESLFGLEEGFRNFIENRAVGIIHPDPLTAGAVRERKRIADYASSYGIPTAVHFAGSPVGCMACVQRIATICGNAAPARTLPKTEPLRSVPE